MAGGLRSAGVAIGRGFLDLLAPPSCRVCGEATLDSGGVFCVECEARIGWIDAACPVCGFPLPGGRAVPEEPEDREFEEGPSRRGEVGDDSAHELLGCAHCPPLYQGGRQIERASAAGIYDGPLRLAVLRYKFQRDEGVEPFLVDTLVAASERPWIASTVSAADAIVPVPQHWIRHVTRGWSPVDELCAAFASRLNRQGMNLPVRRLLRKKRWTAPQMQLAASHRATSPRGAFAMRRGKNPPRRVILVDDVITTGSTARECARVLRHGGVSAVALIAIARSV